MSDDRRRGNGYSRYAVVPEYLFEVASDMYSAMRERCPERPIVLVYTGFSGSSLASGILTVAGMKKDTNISGYYVRKKGDGSHSGRNERVLKVSCKNVIFVYVDDFVCSGATMQRMRSAVKTGLGYSAWDQGKLEEMAFLWSNDCKKPSRMKDNIWFDDPKMPMFIWEYKDIFDRSPVAQKHYHCWF